MANSRQRVALVARREAGVTGTSRYVGQLSQHLLDAGVDVRPVYTGPPLPRLTGMGRRVGIGLDAFWTTYPVRLAARGVGEVDVYHLTSQNLATLLCFQKFRRPVVVTVHDIIPYLTRNDRRRTGYRHAVHRFFDLLAMRGLKRADFLLADSNWTRHTLIQELRIDPNRVQVTYLGVNPDRFRPLPVPDDFWRRHGLHPRHRHLLYVGSDDPRKNLESLLWAFSKLSCQRRELHLVLVGAVYRASEARRLTALGESLGINTRMKRIGPVPEEDLPLFYNAADLVVVPSTLEGFGLPVLESLACGTGVVCSNTASLPEVAGADSITCSPLPDAIAAAVVTGLAHDCDCAREGRRNWALQFSWARMAQQVQNAYALVGARARRER